MKNYIKEFIILIIQLFMFYIFPLFAGPTDAIGMVMLIILSVLILSILIGFLKSKIKYFYPLIVSILFIPSVFIYYNESALIHSIWYLVISTIGLLVGILLHKLINKFNN